MEANIDLEQHGFQVCGNADSQCTARPCALGIYLMELSPRRCVIVDAKCYVNDGKLSVQWPTLHASDSFGRWQEN
jgi:hypothetical protein